MQTTRREASKLTFLGYQGPAAEKQQIDAGLPGPDITANVVNVLEKTDIVFNKMIFAGRVKIVELCLDTFALDCSTSNEVDARLLCVFGELFERSLPNATCCTYKNCNKPSGETSGDVRA